MGIKTQKVLRLISKIILILVGVGLVGIAGYYAYKSIAFKPQNVVVTNITDGSATVTWTTTSPMKGIVYVKKDKALLPGPLGIVGSTMVYDDRDVSDAQKACVDAFNKKASETKDSTFSVSGSNFDCENVKVTKIGSYYTHSVTITNLDENSTYNFVVGDGIWSFKESVSTVKTFAVLETVGEPMPVFGRITGDDSTYSRDAIVYITFNDGSESKDSIVYSSAVNDDGGWYVDASAVRDVDGNVLPLEVTNDTFRVKGIYSDYGVSEEQQFIYGFFEVATFDITVKKTELVKDSLLNKWVMGAYAGLASCSNCPSWMTPEIVKEIEDGVSDARAKELGYGNVLKVLSGGDKVLDVEEKKVLPASMSNEYELNYIANAQNVSVSGSSGGGGSDDTFVEPVSGTPNDTNRDTVVDVPGSPCNYIAGSDVCHDYGSKTLVCTQSGNWLYAYSGQCGVATALDKEKNDPAHHRAIGEEQFTLKYDNEASTYSIQTSSGTVTNIPSSVVSNIVAGEDTVLATVPVLLYPFIVDSGLDITDLVNNNEPLKTAINTELERLKAENTEESLQEITDICNAYGGGDLCPSGSSVESKVLGVSKAYASDTNSSTLYLPEYGMYSFQLGNYTMSTNVSDGKTIYLFYLESNGKDGFQMPVDPDNPTVDEDIILKSNAYQISYTQTSTAQQYEIKKGINIISFDFVPVSLDLQSYTARDLIDQAVGDKVEIKYISTFEGGRWSSGYSCVGDICTGDNFTIVPGKGYLVYATQDGTVTIPGYNLTSSVPVAFSAGWNLVGVHGYTTAYTARSFIDSVNTIEGLTANNVSWWPTSKSKYEGLQVDGNMEYGLDFSMSPNNGYFVRISKFAPADTKCKSLIWNAGGNLNGTCGNTK